MCEITSLNLVIDPLSSSLFSCYAECLQNPGYISSFNSGALGTVCVVTPQEVGLCSLVDGTSVGGQLYTDWQCDEYGHTVTDPCGYASGGVGGTGTPWSGLTCEFGMGTVVQISLMGLSGNDSIGIVDIVLLLLVL